MNTVSRRRGLRNWWKGFGIGLLAVIACLMIWLNVRPHAASSAGHSNQAAARATSTQAAAPASAGAAVTTEGGVPQSLANAGEYGENVYDYAKANDWKNADVKLAALGGAVTKVRADVTNKSGAVEGLDGKVTALERAVTARDRQSAMREANQVTLEVANMSTAYKLSAPVEVTRLDYYGRELEVWAQAQEANKLQATAREMRRTWESLRPSVEVKSATQAKKFEALVAQVEGARAPADYGRAAAPVLKEVDNLEKLFH